MDKYRDYPDRRGEKGMIYILISIIVLLLIVAIAVILYLSSKMMDIQKGAAPQQQASQAEKVEPAKLSPSSAAPAQSRPNKLAAEDIATIVQLVMTQMQKSQKPVTPERIEQTVKKEQSKKSDALSDDSMQDSSDEIESVISALGNMDADTVEEKEISLSENKTKTMSQTRASATAPKASDNFNKVVVQNSETDEFSQLDSELEQLSQENEEPNSAYAREMTKEVQERKNEMRTIVVQEGDTLSSMARKAYGDSSKYIKILRANPGIIKNPDRIFVGQTLRVPK